MKEKLTWNEVLSKTPGPKNRKEFVSLFVKGMAMGAADIIPGVSGGTIAFITGIYEKLIFAISSINLNFLKKIIRFRIKEALASVHIKFLILLFSGIALSIITMSRLMNFLMTDYKVLTWSFFFGLILASILVIGIRIKKFFGLSGLVFLLGLGLGYFVVGLIPVETPAAWWFIVLSGSITATAMILPGISGAFILLILGKYQFMTAALKNPFVLDNFFIIVLFLSGCTIGILSFARFFGLLFKKYYSFTFAFLTGLITASLRKIWPWKEAIETKLLHGELIAVKEKNILPSFDSELFFAITLIAFGILLVAHLNLHAKKKFLKMP